MLALGHGRRIQRLENWGAFTGFLQAYLRRSLARGSRLSVALVLRGLRLSGERIAERTAAPLLESHFGWAVRPRPDVPAVRRPLARPGVEGAFTA